MKLLLDECMPRRLKRNFKGCRVFTVEDAGLKGLKNGQLLQKASGKYDVLVTVDKSIPSQQNLVSLNIAFLILRAKNNKYNTLKELVPKAIIALENIQPGDVVIIE
jgi:predicted nuclease of predicted toxin-antitoxin system